MKNIFKTASLLAAAVVLFSCGGENGDPTGGTDASGDIMIVSDKDVSSLTDRMWQRSKSLPAVRT